MVQIPQLETERLLLRAPEERDYAGYQSFFTDGDASHFYGGPISPTDAWNKLARDIGHWHLRGYGQWSLEDKETNAFVGSCGLAWPAGWPRPELTWWIAKPARRKGFAKEASIAAIQFAYDKLNWELVQTHMKDENTAAKSLVLSLGGERIAREDFPDGIERNVYRLPGNGILGER